MMRVNLCWNFPLPRPSGRRPANLGGIDVLQALIIPWAIGLPLNIDVSDRVAPKNIDTIVQEDHRRECPPQDKASSQ